MVGHSNDTRSVPRIDATHHHSRYIQPIIIHHHTHSVDHRHFTNAPPHSEDGATTADSVQECACVSLAPHARVVEVDWGVKLQLLWSGRCALATVQVG